MSLTEAEVPRAISSFLKGMGMSLICVKAIKYHEYKEEEKPLLKMAGLATYDNKTWYTTVQVLDHGGGITKLFDVVCDAKTGKCRMLPGL